MEYPKLRKIKAGWAALGNGWAVHAPSEDDARRLFLEAEQRNRAILERQPGDADSQETKEA
jgi:hypothetical protein